MVYVVYEYSDGIFQLFGLFEGGDGKDIKELHRVFFAQLWDGIDWPQHNNWPSDADEVARERQAVRKHRLEEFKQQTGYEGETEKELFFSWLTAIQDLKPLPFQEVNL